MTGSGLGFAQKVDYDSIRTCVITWVKEESPTMM